MSEGSREYIRGNAPTCASRFVRESKDPCKMAYSIVALVNRDLFTKNIKHKRAVRKMGQGCVQGSHEHTRQRMCSKVASARLCPSVGWGRHDRANKGQNDSSDDCADEYGYCEQSRSAAST